MKNNQRFLLRILDEIAREHRIQLERFSYDWIIRLQKKEQIRHVFGYNFEINSAASYLLAQDKCAASEVLAAGGIPAVEHKLFLHPDKATDLEMEGGNWSAMLNFFDGNGAQLICKPVCGTGGTGVEKAESRLQLETQAHRLFAHSGDLCLSPLIRIKHEYRIVILDGRAELIYRKERPFVTGDGQKTMLELAAGLLGDDAKALASVLKSGGCDWTARPARGEIVRLNWKSNLGLGARPIGVERAGEKGRTLAELALKAGGALNIRFASVDIIEDDSGGLLVLEINSGVMMESYLKVLPDEYGRVKAIYEKAVLTMMDGLS